MPGVQDKGGRERRGGGRKRRRSEGDSWSWKETERRRAEMRVAGQRLPGSASTCSSSGLSTPTPLLVDSYFSAFFFFSLGIPKQVFIMHLILKGDYFHAKLLHAAPSFFSCASSLLFGHQVSSLCSHCLLNPECLRREWM